MEMFSGHQDDSILKLHFAAIKNFSSTSMTKVESTRIIDIYLLLHRTLKRRATWHRQAGHRSIGTRCSTMCCDNESAAEHVDGRRALAAFRQRQITLRRGKRVGRAGFRRALRSRSRCCSESPSWSC